MYITLFIYVAIVRDVLIKNYICKNLYTLLGREGEMKSSMKNFIRNNLGGRKKIDMINKRIFYWIPL